MSTGKKNFLVFAPLVLFAVALVMFWLALGQDPKLLPSALIGKPMPEISLPTLSSDESHKLSLAISRKPALLNVWATWCPTCKEEHAVLNELAAKGVPIYGLNYKDDRRKAGQWLVDFGNPYHEVFYDEDGQAGLDLGVYGAPETYVIGRDGSILHRQVGAITLEIWQQTLQPILEAKP